MVIERKREDSELDGVRWFVPNSSQPLYEKWFHCSDLGVQLAPVIKEFFSSDEYKTKVPKDHVLDKMPFDLNPIELNTNLHGPYNLQQKIKSLSGSNNKLILTPNEMKMQFIIEILGFGEHEIENLNNKGYDCWLWQIDGLSNVKISDSEAVKLSEKDSLLIPSNITKSISISVTHGHLLKVIQDIKLK